MKQIGEVVRDYLESPQQLDALAAALVESEPVYDWRGVPVTWAGMSYEERDRWRERARAALRHVASW